MEQRWDVVVVGAGLAGLAAAATAAAAGGSVLVIESGEPGGRGITDQIGRFRFNRGPHALYRTVGGRAVLDRLGVRVRGGPPVVKGALGRRGDRIDLLPGGAGSLLRTRLFSGRDKAAIARVLARMRGWRPETLADRTAAAWFDDLGLAGGARALVTMLTCVTSFIADVEQVSADVVAQQLRAGIRDGVDYLDGGWGTIVAGLGDAARRRGAQLRTHARVRAVVPDDGRVIVELADDTVLARRVVLAVGGPNACTMLLRESPVAWRGLGPAAHVACLDLGLRAVPEIAVLFDLDRLMYLSRHAPPAALAPAGASVICTARYLRSDDDPAPDAARADLADHCRAAGIDPDDAEESRYLHRMSASSAIPTPERGGLAGRPAVDSTGHGGVLVAGDWVGPTGHLSDAALLSGEAAGRDAALGLEHDRVVQPVTRPA